MLTLIGDAIVAGLLPTGLPMPDHTIHDPYVTSATWCAGPQRLHVSRDEGDATMHVALYDGDRCIASGRAAADRYQRERDQRAAWGGR